MIAMRILQILFICAAVLLESRCAKSKDEGRPYEFGFTIDGQQHRHEKKDANGIIQGEFGFITADGIYHVTTYATDENGSFRILSMKNVRVSDPLDGSGGNNFKKAKKLQTNAPLVNSPPPSKPSPSPEIIRTTREPYKFTTQATIKPACAGCGYVTRPSTTQKPLAEANQNQIAQTPSPQNKFSQPSSTSSRPSSSGGITADISIQNQHKPDVYAPDVRSQSPFIPHLQADAPVSQAGSVQSPIGPSQSVSPVGSSPAQIPSQFVEPPAVSQQESISQQQPISQQTIPAQPHQDNMKILPNIETKLNQQDKTTIDTSNSPEISRQTIPTVPLQPPQDDNQILLPNIQTYRNQENVDKTVIGTLHYPGSSRADKIRVENGSIYVPNNPPIKIKDKYPNMVDGLPDGIEEKDIVGLLYKFNYTIGFHGHYEKGLRNGTKIGGYFVNGRDGISRIVTYVADERGYRPKFRLINLGLDSPDTPKAETEKTFGLKNFEFVWYPLK